MAESSTNSLKPTRTHIREVCMLNHAKLCRSLGVPLLFLFMLIFTLNSCTDQTPISFEPPKGSVQLRSKIALLTKEEAAKDIRLIAKGLAMILRDEQNRRILETEQKAANTVEDKIDVIKFIRDSRTMLIAGEKRTTSFEAMFASVLSEQERIDLAMSLEKLPPGYFDVYFPVRSHRISWSAGQADLLVAAVEPGYDETMIGAIEAYDIRGGKHLLNKKTPPETPTLVVAPNELRGQYPKKQAALAGTGILRNSRSEVGVVLGPEDPPQHLYVFNLVEFKITDDWDPWPSGDMEIYFRVENGGTWYRTNTKEDVVEGIYYTLNWWIASNYFSTVPIMLEIWEEDGAFSGDDFVADVWYSQNYPEFPTYDRFSSLILWGGPGGPSAPQVGYVNLIDEDRYDYAKVQFIDYWF